MKITSEMIPKNAVVMGKMLAIEAYDEGKDPSEILLKAHRFVQQSEECCCNSAISIAEFALCVECENVAEHIKNFTYCKNSPQCIERKPVSAFRIDPPFDSYTLVIKRPFNEEGRQRELASVREDIDELKAKGEIAANWGGVMITGD